MWMHTAGRSIGPVTRRFRRLANWRCVPLAARPLRIPDTRQAVAAGLIMAVAVGVAALGLLPAAIAFAAGVLASMALRTVPPRSVYDAVDWPVIVLLAALIPVAGAMERTGAADVIGRFLLEGIAQGQVGRHGHHIPRHDVVQFQHRHLALV